MVLGCTSVSSLQPCRIWSVDTFTIPVMHNQVYLSENGVDPTNRIFAGTWWSTMAFSQTFTDKPRYRVDASIINNKMWIPYELWRDKQYIYVYTHIHINGTPHPHIHIHIHIHIHMSMQLRHKQSWSPHNVAGFTKALRSSAPLDASRDGYLGSTSTEGSMPALVTG